MVTVNVDGQALVVNSRIEQMLRWLIAHQQDIQAQRRVQIQFDCADTAMKPSITLYDPALRT